MRITHQHLSICWHIIRWCQPQKNMTFSMVWFGKTIKQICFLCSFVFFNCSNNTKRNWADYYPRVHHMHKQKKVKEQPLLGLDLTYQDMPNILIGSFKAAEADTSAQQTLTTPHVTGYHLQLPHPLGFRVVHFKFDRFLHICFQEVFQQVTFFILERERNMDYSSCDSTDKAFLLSCKRT